MTEPMKICFAVSECVPFVKTGGLADVGGALPRELEDEGCDVRVFVPLYGSIRMLENGLTLIDTLRDIPVPIGGKIVNFNVWEGSLPDSGVPVYLIDCPEYYHRPQPYTMDPDEDERFIMFQQAILQVLRRLQWAPNIIHCNDWQTCLLPAYLRLLYKSDTFFAQTACLLSIHNIAYQGLFPQSSVLKTGLPHIYYYPGGPFELGGSFCFMKPGIVYSEVINTVSQTYAEEIQTPAYGAGLEGVLGTRANDLYGVLNGIDDETWNPKLDERIPYRYDFQTRQNKQRNKKGLLKTVGLPFDQDTPVIGIISRLFSQKGFDLLEPIIDKVMKLPLQIVALGSGDPHFEDFFRASANKYGDKFSCYVGFNDELAHLITAGADMFLMPSRYEPCGLNQMYSLNYGTVPIVRKTGGLADTVRDYHEYAEGGNGFSFTEPSPDALYLTIQRALDMFGEKNAWRQIMKRGMHADFSWKASALKYVELYKKSIQRHVNLTSL